MARAMFPIYGTAVAVAILAHTGSTQALPPRNAPGGGGGAGPHSTPPSTAPATPAQFVMPARARAAWSARNLVVANGKATVEIPIQSEEGKAAAGVAVGAGVLFFLTLGMVELWKDDCPKQMTTIDWDLIKHERPASDGDRFVLVEFTPLPNTYEIPSDMIAINLRLGKNVSWKKTLLMGDASTAITRVVATAEGAGSQSGVVFIPAKPELYLVFQKPKRLAHWCSMYELFGTNGVVGGHGYELIWMRD